MWGEKRGLKAWGVEKRPAAQQHVYKLSTREKERSLEGDFGTAVDVAAEAVVDQLGDRNLVEAEARIG